MIHGIQFERTINEMRIGESGWTVPRAASWDAELETVVLHVGYSIDTERPKRHLTPQLLVIRSEDGYHLKDYSSHKFSLGGAYYIGGGELMPVASYEKVR